MMMYSYFLAFDELDELEELTNFVSFADIDCLAETFVFECFPQDKKFLSR